MCWPLSLHIGGPETTLVPKLGAVLVSLWVGQSAGLCFFWCFWWIRFCDFVVVIDGF